MNKMMKNPIVNFNNREITIYKYDSLNLYSLEDSLKEIFEVYNEMKKIIDNSIKDKDLQRETIKRLNENLKNLFDCHTNISFVDMYSLCERNIVNVMLLLGLILKELADQNDVSEELINEFINL